MCGLLLKINCTEKVNLEPEKWSSVDFLWLWKSAAIEIFNPLEKVAPELCDPEKDQLSRFLTLKNCSPRIFVTQKKVQLSRILPFTGAARALGVKSEETIKANSISIVEILQYENSNKLNWSTQFSQYQRKFRFPFLSLPSKTLSADVCVCFF